MSVMKTSLISIAVVGLAVVSCGADKPVPTVKDHFKNDFLIGAAVPVRLVNGLDPKADSVITMHFNSIVSENSMKCEKIHPHEYEYNWDDADTFMKYGEDRNMAIIGHVLVWHSQLAPWFAYDSVGNYVTADVLKERMRDHIHTVVGHYKGRIKGWDVVNEAIMEDGCYRHSPFYDIIGEEFIPLAFQYAHEADPDVELYINDYSMWEEPKRNKYIEIVNDLKARGLRIDGIGMQSHIGMDYPELSDYEESIKAFAATGVPVMITELDMSAIPTIHKSANVNEHVDFKAAMNPYKEGLPAEVSQRWNERMDSVFDIYKNNADVITRVTWWGTHDGMSWRNNFPMFGRTDYPLLFDRNYNMKQFMQDEINRESSKI